MPGAGSRPGNLQTLRVVRDALSTSGYAPLVTGDPQQLSRIIRTEKPRLVLLDLMLPGITGDRVDGADSRVHRAAGHETIARALEVGAVDYIVKPFSPTELTARRPGGAAPADSRARALRVAASSASATTSAG